MDNLVCNHCKQQKPASEFNRNKNTRSGYHGYCRSCGKAFNAARLSRNRAHNTANPTNIISKKCNKCKQIKASDEFFKDISSRNGLTKCCKSCDSERRKMERKAHPGRHKYSAIKSRYGLTRAEYDTMLQKQNGVCAICSCVDTTVVNGGQCLLSVDHDHETGKIRGLLCHKCNTGIGMLATPENCIRAAQYLKAHHQYDTA